MISTSDVGMYYDIHPKEKKVLGHRYFLQAVDKIYEKHCLADAPMLSGVEIEENKINLTIKNLGAGMSMKQSDFLLFELQHNGEEIPIACAKKNGDTIVLETCDKIKKPITISFGHKPYYQIQLYNSEEIPCIPFVVQVL